MSDIEFTQEEPLDEEGRAFVRDLYLMVMDDDPEAMARVQARNIERAEARAAQEASSQKVLH